MLSLLKIKKRNLYFSLFKEIYYIGNKSFSHTMI